MFGHKKIAENFATKMCKSAKDWKCVAFRNTQGKS